MPLIDGTYEILRQRPDGPGRRRVHATDPDGRPVRIVWYEPAPGQERTFERHRRALRRLRHDDDVALRDVVSRPGARYEVWDEPPPGSEPAAPDGPWRERLEAVGIDPARAELRRDGRRLVLIGVAFAPGAAAADGRPDVGDAIGPHPVASAPDASGRGVAPAPGPLRALTARLATAPGPIRTWAVAAGLTLLTAGLLAIGWSRTTVDAVAQVPDLVGDPADAASRTLAELGFAVDAQPLAAEGVPGTVLRLDPPPGAALRPGRTVRLEYVRADDAGAARPVPSLTGRELGEVAARLASDDLRQGDVVRVPARLPAGTVLAQRPAADAPATPGSAVDLLVSDGPSPERTFLPDLVGMPLDEARDWVRLAGLPADRVQVDPVSVPDVPPGHVVGTTPAAWHPFRSDGTTVRLLVADPDAGAGRTTLDDVVDGGPRVPDLVGLDVAEARSVAAEHGFSVQERRTVNAALPRGVVSHEPPPGAPRGDGTVTLLANVRPLPLPRPDPVAHVVAPSLRWMPYRFLVEPGIPAQTARVTARTVDGTTETVLEREAAGGEVLEGRWPTLAPGPVTFELTLNDVPYAELRVNQPAVGP